MKASTPASTGRAPVAGSVEELKAQVAGLRKEVRELSRANEILRAASTFFGAELDGQIAAVTMFVIAHRAKFGVVPICRALGVSVASVRSRLSRPFPARVLADEALSKLILELYEDNYSVYAPAKASHGAAA